MPVDGWGWVGVGGCCSQWAQTPCTGLFTFPPDSMFYVRNVGVWPTATVACVLVMQQLGWIWFILLALILLPVVLVLVVVVCTVLAAS